jgi:glycosyltransferase involved in cell wall biosynthesis
VFVAVGDTGIQAVIGTRYVIVRNEDIGPRVIIHRNAKKLPNGINVIGSLNYEFGLGEAARGMVQAVQQAGIPNTAILAPMGRNSGKCNDFDYDKVGRTLHCRFNLFVLTSPEMQCVRKRWPKVFTNGQYNIGFWYYELPRLPHSWIDGFNGLNEVWVASQFVYDAVRAVSPIPVYKIPPVVSVVAPFGVTRSEFGLPVEKLCVLSVFDLNSYRQRKNPEAAIAAFKLAHKKKQDLHLVLKVNNAVRNQQALKILQERLIGFGSVTLITEVLPRAALTRLQATCDVFISLHRSEGFGLNLAECMALGKPIIATNWSANVDYMNSENSCPVNYTLVELVETIGPYEKGQVWAEPSIEHAAEYLVDLAASPKLRVEIGQKAKATMEALYSPTAVASAIKRRYEAIAGRL